jgi:hypothetical protein
MRRSAEMGVVVIDMLTSPPILVLNFGAFLPIVMTHVMMIVALVRVGWPIHADRSKCEHK